MSRDECSYGIIPLRYNDISKEWDVLLVRHRGGHWSFPKGHANVGESYKETAIRELYEETGLTVESFLFENPLSESYSFFFQKTRIFKTVLYYIASVSGEVVIQVEEISDSCWLPLDRAGERMTFPEGESLCLQTIQLLKLKH